MRKSGVIFITAMAIIASVTGCGDSSKYSEVSTEFVSTTEASTTQSHEATTAVKETVAEKSTNEYYVTKKFETQALAGNLVNEPTEKKVYVYLPPSYYDSEKTYPVVYYLHGYGENSNSFVSGSKHSLNSAFEGGADEFILVGLEGSNKFFTNSPVTGNWEDYLINEAIPFVDENFRTISDKDSRGICGFSMGGYGAYSLALNHPDVFNSFIAMSPGLIEDGDFPSVLESWKSDAGFKKAYAQTFSPNLEDTEQYGNIPELSGTEEDNKIVDDWNNGYGNINKRLDEYIALNQPLKAMKIIYGESDYYEWIPRGSEFLAKCLEERGIEHSVDTFEGGHMLHPEVVENYIVPFFNENLNY